MKACVVIQGDASKQGNVQKEDLVNLTPTPGNKRLVWGLVHYDICSLFIRPHTNRDWKTLTETSQRKTLLFRLRLYHKLEVFFGFFFFVCLMYYICCATLSHEATADKRQTESKTVLARLLNGYK